MPRCSAHTGGACADNGYGLSACSPSQYWVLEWEFPSSDDPKLVATTSSKPRPDKAVGPPAAVNYKGYSLCAAKDTNLASDGKLVAGNLGSTPNGPLGCLVSKSFGLGGLSNILLPGQYMGLSGTVCQLPADDDF